MKSIFYSLVLVLKITRFAALALILTALFGLALPYIHKASSYAVLRPVIQLDKSVNKIVKQTIPTRIAGYDASRIITIILLMIIAGIISNLIEKMNAKMEMLTARKELERFTDKKLSKSQQARVEEMKERIEHGSEIKRKNRKDLLNDFMLLKKELESTGRTLSFLAIDVVDSTGMKVGEDTVNIEYDFNQYNDFLVNHFKTHGYVKASWTPDGVMVCFNTTEQAIDAAKSIINDLKEFNQSVKSIKADFHVRCGINTGFVYYDLTTPLEKYSDRVLDIAGHLQKHAPIDSILIAKDIVKPIESHEVFKEYSQSVDGLEVYEWQSESKSK